MQVTCPNDPSVFSGWSWTPKEFSHRIIEHIQKHYGTYNYSTIGRRSFCRNYPTKTIYSKLLCRVNLRRNWPKCIYQKTGCGPGAVTTFEYKSSPAEVLFKDRGHCLVFGYLWQMACRWSKVKHESGTGVWLPMCFTHQQRQTIANPWMELSFTQLTFTSEIEEGIISQKRPCHQLRNSATRILGQSH